MSSFYRPPTLATAVSDLINTFSSLGPGFTSKSILVGDFNINVGNSQAPLLNQVSSLSSIFSLSQIVTQPTHYSHSGSPSIIDLVFVPRSAHGSATVTPPLGSSDHCTIISSLSFSFKPPPSHHQSHRKVWLYHKADFNTINDSLNAIDWSSTLPQDLDIACSKFTSIFLQIINEHVPSKFVSHQPLPPWLSRPLLHKIRHRRKLFHRAAVSNSLVVCAMLFLLRLSDLNHNFSLPSPTHLRNFGLMYVLSDETRTQSLLLHAPLAHLSQMPLVKPIFSTRLFQLFSLSTLVPQLLPL